MSGTIFGLDQEEEILTYQVSDEALEIRQGRGTEKRDTTRFISALLWISAQAPERLASLHMSLNGSGLIAV